MTITLTRDEAQQVLDVLNDVRYRIEFGQMNLSDDTDAAIEILRARLAQPESEPLIKMKELLKVQGWDGNWNLDPYMQGMYNGMELIVALAEGRDPVFRKAPENWLSAPPQREWQGLTDEERLRCFDDVDWNKVDWCPDHEQYAKAIEAKLKEKNA